MIIFLQHCISTTSSLPNHGTFELRNIAYKNKLVGQKMSGVFIFIYFLFQGQFLFLEVNGNEENVVIFFTDALQCVQRIVRETDNLGHDGVIMERLISELIGYTRTVSFLLSINQQFEGRNNEGNFGALEALHACFQSIINSYQNSRSVGRNMLTLGVSTVRTGHPGRPIYNILHQQIAHCLDFGMNWGQIAVSFGISRRTLYRHRQQLQIASLSYTAMSDEALRDIIRAILQTTPYSGERYIRAALQTRNLRIQRWRVRRCLQHLDPIGRAFRRAIHRRIYSVQNPNQLW